MELGRKLLIAKGEYKNKNHSRVISELGNVIESKQSSMTRQEIYDVLSLLTKVNLLRIYMGIVHGTYTTYLVVYREEGLQKSRTMPAVYIFTSHGRSCQIWELTERKQPKLYQGIWYGISKVLETGMSLLLIETNAKLTTHRLRLRAVYETFLLWFMMGKCVSNMILPCHLIANTANWQAWKNQWIAKAAMHCLLRCRWPCTTSSGTQILFPWSTTLRYTVWNPMYPLRSHAQVASTSSSLRFGCYYQRSFRIWRIPPTMKLPRPSKISLPKPWSPCMMNWESERYVVFVKVSKMCFVNDFSSHFFIFIRHLLEASLESFGNRKQNPISDWHLSMLPLPVRFTSGCE